MKKAVTLTEIIIGAVILAAAFGGLLASFIGARQYIQRANKRLVAANLARQTVNDLYRFVREDEWRLITNPLYAPDSGKHLHPIINYTIDNISYEDNQYEVESVANRDYRAARVTIHYPEE